MRSARLPAFSLGFVLLACGGDDSPPPVPPAAAPTPPPATPGPTDPKPEVPGPTPEFQLGEAFDYAQVGSSRSQMVQAMIEAFDYMASPAPKAIAINKVGLGFVSVKPGATQEDAERIAKEVCSVIGGGGPCHLLARGNNFAISATTLADDAQGFVLATPTTLGPLPFMTAAASATEIQKYEAVGAKPKALAIGFDGVAARAPGNATALGAADDADASRTALERCEMMSLFAPCTLFAVGTQIVFDPKKPNWAPRIDYARRSVTTNITGSVGPAYTNYIASEYVTPVRSGTAGAIYVTRDGAGGYATGSAAEATALANCNKNKTSTEPCIPYARNLNIVFQPTDLYALTKGTVKTHCLAMPRLNCAAHKAIGCAPGKYYTATWGTPAIETCD